MNRLLSTAILLAVIPTNANAETQIWLSPVGVPDGTVTVGNQDEAFEFARQSGELNVWIRPEAAQVFNIGVSLNLKSTNPGVIDFTEVVVHNPSVSDIPPLPEGVTAFRWKFLRDSTRGVPLLELSRQDDNEISLFQGFNAGTSFDTADTAFIGMGSDAAKNIDRLYDPVADAWLFATVEYDVVGLGKTDLFLQIAKNGIAGHRLRSRMVNVVFGAGNDPPLNAESQRQTNSLTSDGSITVVEDFVARLVTGSPVSLSQTVDTPGSLFDLAFDYQFRSTTGVLDVLLDGMSVGTITAPTSLTSEFTTASFRIDGELLNRTDVDLEFLLDGPARSSLLLNNVAFPEVVNGDFQTEGLAGWTMTTSARGTVESLGLSTIPEPPGILLASVCLIGLLLGSRLPSPARKLQLERESDRHRSRLAAAGRPARLHGFPCAVSHQHLFRPTSLIVSNSRAMSHIRVVASDHRGFRIRN